MQKIGDIPNTRADNNGEFTDGNVAAGVPPTILPAEWFNTIQRELINVLISAGIEPDSDKFDQVATAVTKLITDGGFLKTANNLSEIKNAGAAAVATALANLGLGTAATKNVGTGAGQIPDMSAWSFVKNADNSKWTLTLPNGFLLQRCSVVTSGAAATINAVWLTPFPIECLGVWGMDGSSGTADLSSSAAGSLPVGRVYAVGSTNTYAPVGGYGGIDIYAIGH
ncbi:bacteriophage tail fiber protein [Yersinia frederiksenii]|nr:hypothetical protein [Yersinia vastinensis]CNI70401.1 bacteriophage tail fiber protein [Yersinia frederiksenii]